ncbi:cytochrome P450 72A397 isoform X2 [Ricinus communis]|uniref:Cytochrome P450, putative n=1 Tax=Ricinus communis TaxID=3988 RepID=B9RQW1_RICCO|nr:cytochrome P450 72A397 isoform X2 [Ricinus communis]EEF46132.1 cytochrome P450, putative [Ricinus communis]|eukprot:XP_002516130.1 cytochrome P450 CYP72A219 isoform X2 [Ricinus communis]
MECSISKTLLLSCVLLSLYSVIRFAYMIWFGPKRLEKQLRKQGIRGNSYKLFNGDGEAITKSSMRALSKPIALNDQINPRVLPFFHEMVKNYGKVSLSWFGTRPRLILADPEMIRWVLTDKNGHFVKPPLNPLVNLLQLGVSTLEGDKWAKRRKLMTPAFHYEKLKCMVPQFATSCSDLINRWKKLVSPKGLCEIDVATEFDALAGDVIARTAFGSSYQEGKRIFELQKEQVSLVLEAYRSIYIPGLRFIPTKKNKRRYDIDDEIKATLRDMIRRKEQAMQIDSPSNVDLLSLLIRCKREAASDMTNEDIIEECKLLYFAGQETTANWLTWTLIVLSRNPNWQVKAREEVLQICGKKIPEIEDLNRLKSVTMILNEVFRLYPPVAALYRHTLKETNIKGMSIPAGVELYLPTIFVHHDPDYWGDNVEEFRPERFAEGVSKASKDQMAFYPFGWGPRICLGQNFANIEAKMALAMILQNFWFELSPSYTHAPYVNITLRPQHGAPVILHQI